MSKTSGILATACLLVAAMPAWAGDLTVKEGGPVWRPAKCVRPVPPESVMDADAETRGDKMNALIKAYNVYAANAQAYVNCVSDEAEADQRAIDQAITSGAKDEITSVLTESEKLSVPLRGPKN